MLRLKDAYANLQRILGSDTEPFKSVQLVEEFRRYWKPDKVRVILLAESHVFTSDLVRQIPIRSREDLPGSPTQYARFVYCLAYGENDLIPGNTLKRDGTPHFWKIFFSCNNPITALSDFSPILSQTQSETRIRNKIQLLYELKANGIWLVDASIVGLYKDGKKLPYMFSALEESWQSYTREVVISANPEFVICIGKGVGNIVKDDLERLYPERFTIIPQPNARLSAQEHYLNYQKYSRICFERDYTTFSQSDLPALANSTSISNPIRPEPCNGRDLSKFIFEGQELSKGRLVLSVVKRQISKNPLVDFNGLLADFPKNIQGGYGVFDHVQVATEIVISKGHKRHFVEDDELLTLTDGKIAVCSQWNTNNIRSFIDRANELGYEVRLK